MAAIFARETNGDNSILVGETLKMQNSKNKSDCSKNRQHHTVHYHAKRLKIATVVSALFVKKMKKRKKKQIQSRFYLFNVGWLLCTENSNM